MPAIVEKTVYGNLIENGCRAEVTLCPLGVDGYHVHTTYEDAGVDDRAGLCGTVATEAEAWAMYERACELAAEWFARHRTD